MHWSVCAVLKDKDWESVNVLLNCGSPVKRNLQEIWPHLPNLQWLHSSAAGVEHILFDDLINGPVTLTNAKVRAALACRPPKRQCGCRVMPMCPT